MIPLDAQTWLLVAVLWCAWIGFAAGVVSLAWWVSKFSLRQVTVGMGLTDKVFYNPGIDAEEVKRGLVEHDGEGEGASIPTRKILLTSALGDDRVGGERERRGGRTDDAGDDADRTPHGARIRRRSDLPQLLLAEEAHRAGSGRWRPVRREDRIDVAGRPRDHTPDTAGPARHLLLDLRTPGRLSK